MRSYRSMLAGDTLYTSPASCEWRKAIHPVANQVYLTQTKILASTCRLLELYQPPTIDDNNQEETMRMNES